MKCVQTVAVSGQDLGAGPAHSPDDHADNDANEEEMFVFADDRHKCESRIISTRITTPP